MSQAWPGRVATHRQPYRNRVGHASCAYRKPPPSDDTKSVSQPRPLLRAVSQGVGRRIAALAHCITTLGLPLLSRYNRLYRDTPQRPSRLPVTIQVIVSRHIPTSQATHASCRTPLLSIGRVVVELWLCRGRGLAISWPSGSAQDCCVMI